jgi:hypothetical protein
MPTLNLAGEAADGANRRFEQVETDHALAVNILPLRVQHRPEPVIGPACPDETANLPAWRWIASLRSQ